YTRLFELVDAVNATSNYQAGVEALVDVENWMRTLAAVQVMGIEDCYGLLHPHNLYACKPAGGRWKLLLYDNDYIFVGDPARRPFHTRPPAHRGGAARRVGPPPFTRAYLRALRDAARGPLVSVANFMRTNYAVMQANGLGAAERPPSAPFPL